MQCRVAPSLGALEGTHDKVWGTTEYTNLAEDTVFFGLYGLPDFYSLWRHEGKRYILWAGSDVLHFVNGYWLEDGGGIKLDPLPLAEWINKHCESWVENEVERLKLLEVGIEAKVCPSFMGDVADYKISFVSTDRPMVYLSANKGREVEYGWGLVEEIADRCTGEFHLYGSDQWKTRHSNVFIHGRVPKEQMNQEIKQMQCGLRLNGGMDGFSEITAKSVLWGQYPLVWSHFKYPVLGSFADKEELIKKLNWLKNVHHPNPARDYYLRTLNKYPWVAY